MDLRRDVLVILCGGYPAPGVNGVISAATIEALNNGMEVIGVYGGWSYLKKGYANHIKSFDYKDVSEIHADPGCILRTSLEQLKTDEDVDNVLRALQLLRAKYLITIGGTRTAFSALQLTNAAKKAGYELSTAHAPKTIFNDLPLPPDTHTFGYDTAKELGMHLVNNLRVDAKSMSQYCLVTILSPRTGQLALGIGKTAAATAVIIPEEFKENVKFDSICKIIEGIILKRRVMNRYYGVIILPQGLVDMMDSKEIDTYFDGSINQARVDLARMVGKHVSKRLLAKNVKTSIKSRYIGSELRSAVPNAVDIELGRDLGYACVKFLRGGGTGSLITFKAGNILPIPLQELNDKKTGVTAVRGVDTKSHFYEVARKYQIRLSEKDLSDPKFLYTLKDKMGITPEEFVAEYGEIAKI